MRHALYIVGAPGAGKTTLVNALTEGRVGFDQKKPVAHTVYALQGVVELGAKRDNGFGGTDALAMNAITAVAEWVQEPPNPIVMQGNLLLAEGDRLAVDRFFEALLAGGWDVTIAHLDTPPETAAARREARGSSQNEKWVRGRETKVAKLVARWQADGRVRVATLDGREGVAFQMARLHLHSPVARALLEGRSFGA